MKLIVVLACFLALAYADKRDDFILKLQEKVGAAVPHCKSETSIGDAELQGIKKFELPKTQEGKCFISCMGKQLDLMTADGKPNKSKIDSVIAEIKDIDATIGGNMEQIREVCLKEITISSDSCQTAYDGFTCLIKEKQTKGFPDIEW